MAKDAVVRLSVQDKGVQQKLNQTNSRFKTFNKNLQADQKTTRLAFNKSQAAVGALGTQLTFIAPELAIIRTAAIAAGKAIQAMGGPILRIAAAAAAIVGTGLAVFFQRTEEGARRLSYTGELLDNHFGSFLDKISQGRILGAFAGLITELSETSKEVEKLVSATQKLEAIKIAGNFVLPFTRLLAQEKKQVLESARLAGAPPSVQRFLKDELLAVSRLGVDIKTTEFNAALEVIKRNVNLGNTFKLNFDVIERLANNQDVSSSEVTGFFDRFFTLLQANQGDIQARHAILYDLEQSRLAAGGRGLATAGGQAFFPGGGARSARGRKLLLGGNLSDYVDEKFEENFSPRKNASLAKALESLPSLAQALRKLVSEQTGFIKLPTEPVTETFRRGAPLTSFPSKYNLGPGYQFSDYPGDAGIAFPTSSPYRQAPTRLDRAFPDIVKEVPLTIATLGIDLETELQNVYGIMERGLLELSELGFADLLQRAFDVGGVDVSLGLKELGNQVAFQLGDYIQQLGYSLVKAGLAKKGIDLGIESLATFLGGAGAIAAGFAAIGIGSAIKGGARNRATTLRGGGIGSAGARSGGGIGSAGVPGSIPINPSSNPGNVNIVNIILQPGLRSDGTVFLRAIKNANSRNVRVTGGGILP